MLSAKFVAIAILAAAGPTAALAQVTGGYPPGTSVAEIEARERAETARLNQEVLARDAEIVAQNEAEAERYRAAQAAHAEAVATAESQNAANAAAHAEAMRAHEAAMAAWRARVAACQAGDYRACQPG